MDWWGESIGIRVESKIVEDEIMKYKELVDKQIITEEEFSIKGKGITVFY